MSATAKNRNQAAATDLHVLLTRIEKQKVAMEKLQIAVAAATADLTRLTTEFAGALARLAALEAKAAAPTP